MRIPLLIAYTAMGAYLIFGSAGRIALMLGDGQEIDPLPIGGFALGCISLLLLLPAHEVWRHNRNDRNGH